MSEIATVSFQEAVGINSAGEIMSHTTTVALEFKDPSCFEKACEDLGLTCERSKSVTMFDGKKLVGHSVKLEGWKYPIVLSEGKLYFDHYEGSWGDIKLLHALQQRYSRNVAVKTAKAKGYTVKEAVVNGVVELRLTR